MRLLYDFQTFSEQVVGGISRYFLELAARIAREPGFEVTILAPFHVNRWLKPIPQARIIGLRIPPVPGTRRLRRTINGTLTHLWMRFLKPDLVHETYFFPRRLAPPRAKIVLTVFDLIRELLPAFFPAIDPWARFKAAAIARADRLITISHTTRKDLLERFPNIDPRSVTPIHLGAPAPQASYGARPFPEPYFLFVGDRGGYKNFPIVVEAFRRSSTAHRTARLVCYGGGGFTTGERRLLTEGGFRFPPTNLSGAGADGDAVNLYFHAAALVYPSLYEGFGLPLLEAMVHGCPVISSTGGSLPEVAGDAARLFAPTDAADLAIALDEILAADSPLATRLRNDGLARAAQFTWDQTAAQTIGVYRAALAEDRTQTGS